LKGILKDRQCDSNDKTEEVIALAWNDLTVDDVQSVFRIWMSRLAWIITIWRGVST
jgi:hypothetical protein